MNHNTPAQAAPAPVTEAREYVTVIEATRPCNKHFWREPDGSIDKRAGAPIADAVAYTIQVPGLTTMKTVLEQVSNDPRRTLVLGYIPGLTHGQTCRIVSKSNLMELLDLGEGEAAGVHQHKGGLIAARLKANFVQSSWFVIDRDFPPGMPSELLNLSREQWFEKLYGLCPSMRDAGKVIIPSSTGRVIDNGQPLDSPGVHVLMQARDPDDAERFAKAMLLRSFEQGLGFGQTIKGGNKRKATIFDHSAIGRERLLYDGKPTIAEGSGLEVADAVIEVIEGGLVDTAEVLTPEHEIEGMTMGKTSGSSGERWTLTDSDSLTPDVEIETEHGTMTLADYAASDLKHVRCQSPLRPESDSWAAFLDRNAQGQVYLHDVGTSTTYWPRVVTETHFEAIEAPEAQVLPPDAQEVLEELKAELEQRREQLVRMTPSVLRGTEHQTRLYELARVCYTEGPAAAMIGARMDPKANGPLKIPDIKALFKSGLAETLQVVDRYERGVREAEQYLAQGDPTIDPPELLLRAVAAQSPATLAATPAVVITPEEARGKYFEQCSHLAASPYILTQLTQTLEAMGVVGERNICELSFLAATSRLLDEPVSVKIEGPSSSGKSHVSGKVVELIPPEEMHWITGGSEKSLIYADADYRNKLLYITEGTPFQSRDEANQWSYFMRTLLSEGKIRYDVAVASAEPGEPPRTVTIEKDGPIALILTTTGKLHAENETRLLSIHTDESAAQTRRVIDRIAEGAMNRTAAPDVSDWHALQWWLKTGPRAVLIPFIKEISKRADTRRVRLRRDFKALAALMTASALLHQHNRIITDGVIMASLEDYAIARRLVLAMWNRESDRAVNPNVRKVVDTLTGLIEAQRREGQTLNPSVSMTVREIAKACGMEKSTAGLSLLEAAEAGYLVKTENRSRQKGCYEIGSPMPEDDDSDALPELSHVAGQSGFM